MGKSCWPKTLQLCVQVSIETCLPCVCRGEGLSSVNVRSGAGPAQSWAVAGPSWTPHSSCCANLLDENSASMWPLKCFAFSLERHCQTKTLLAAVIKRFVFIRPRLLGEMCLSLGWVGESCCSPVKRVAEAKVLCPQGIFFGASEYLGVTAPVTDPIPGSELTLHSKPCFLLTCLPPSCAGGGKERKSNVISVWI